MASAFAIWHAACSPASAQGLDEAFKRPANAGLFAEVLDTLGIKGFQRSYALVVGVSDFDEFENLPTENDPLRIRDYLIDEAGFDYVHILTNEMVTKARLEELMLDEFFPIVGTDDRFLFYWSGHGVTLEVGPGEVGFLPLSASNNDRFSTMVAMSDISRWDEFLQARQVLYLLDSCFSGLAGVAPQGELEDIAREQLSGPARHMLTAGRGTEQTIAIDALGGSVFTHAVLKGLRGAADAKNGLGSDGLVSVGELKTFVGQEVSVQRAKFNWDASITPQLRDMASSDGAFFFPVAQPAAPGDAELAFVQGALLTLGYQPGRTDGVESFETIRALAMFQGNAGIEITARADQATIVAISIALAEAEDDPNGEVAGMGPGSAKTAEGLVTLGLLDPDAVAEPVAVERALRIFQMAAALPETGAADTDTQQTVEIVLEQQRTDALIAQNVVAATLASEPFRDCETCPEMVQLAGSLALIGRDDGKPEQGPAIQVSIAPFAISRTEVTIEAFNAYVEAEGLDFVSRKIEPEPGCYDWTPDNRLRRIAYAYNQQSQSGAQDPVSCVSLHDAQGYIDWLNTSVDGALYRLPTEAEFEYVQARGISISGRNFDDGTPTCDLRNGADVRSQFPWRDLSCDDGFAGVAPVASLAEDGFGLYDLSGNLWEWTGDCWTATHAETGGSALDNCETGVVRGGSFDDPTDNFHPSVRQPVPVKRQQTNIGFRIARDAS